MKYPDQKLLAAVTPRKSVLYSALLLTGLIVGGGNAQAATLSAGDILTITSGAATYITVSGSRIATGFTGSFFGMDTAGTGKLTAGELTPLAQGTTSLVIGALTAAGASHGAAPTAGDTNAIDAPWAFFGNTGSDYLLHTEATGSTTNGLTMNGWTVTWNGIPAINMGTGAWQPGNCSKSYMNCTGQTFTNSIALISWNGTPGGAYSLNYAATVPAGDPSGFGGVKYFLHLEGTVLVPPALSCSNGSTCTVSPMSGFSSTRIGDTELARASIPLDPDSSTYHYPLHLYYDFSVPAGTGTANVVIPLSNPLPANAVYRLYNANTSQWQSFVVDTFNSIGSAPGTLGGTCPVPGSGSYTAGLTQGNVCVELTILNGGADDTDSSGTTISDPGAITTTSTPVASA
ncbi:MAG: hypothetical protein ACYDB8_12165, partial [Acidiferrobacterales bacterium]